MSKLFHAGLCLGIGLLTACAGLPDKVDRVSLPQATGSQLAPAPGGQWPSARWWKDWNQADLDHLVALAQQQSADVEVAKARWLQAGAWVERSDAARGLKASADASVTHERFSANSYIPPPYGGKVYDDSELSIQASYDFDFWGRQRDLLKSALGEQQARAFEAAGMADLIAVRVAQAYVRYQFICLRQALLQARLAMEVEHLTLQTARTATGLDAVDTLRDLQIDVANSQQLAQSLRQQRDEQRVVLQTLTHQPWASLKLTHHPLSMIATGVPAQLPLDLLSRRHDLAAARARVDAAYDQVEAARAAFYPDVNLAAFAGLSSLTLASLTQTGSLVAGIEPALHIPLFDSGRLRSSLRVERRTAELAVAEYHQVLEQSLEDVNRALVMIRGQDEQQPWLDARMTAQQQHVQGIEQRVHAGLINDNERLRAALLLNSIQDEKAALDEQRLLARIALVQAMGGGFDVSDHRVTMSMRKP
ncbi:MAG: efflux transporter outer membrane subunit [Pseudomonadales bacterium]|nr:efflux transporter outer membrane subunit [Pseudomonadales bacterium]